MSESCNISHSLNIRGGCAGLSSSDLMVVFLEQSHPRLLLYGVPAY